VNLLDEEKAKSLQNIHDKTAPEYSRQSFFRIFTTKLRLRDFRLPP
jgi:hypothetical protein